MINFLRKTNQSITPPWLIELGKRMTKHLPLGFLTHMGLHLVFKPRTKSWGRTGEVLREYVREQKEIARKARAMPKEAVHV